MRRLALTALTTLLTLAVLAPAAMAAEGHDGGEGWWGETNDKIVTNFGFLLIGFFPLFIFLMSVLQHRLDQRKYRKKAGQPKRKPEPGW